MTEETWLTLQEFCRIYRLSKDTVLTMCRKNEVEFIPGSRGSKRLVRRIRDPRWQMLDESSNTDPVENLYILKRQEVAALMGVTPNAVQKMAEESRIRFARIRGVRRFTLAEVRRLLAHRQTGAKRPSKRAASLAVVAWASRKLASDPVQNCTK